MPPEAGEGGKNDVDGGCDVMNVTLRTSAGRQPMARSTAPPRPRRHDFDYRDVHGGIMIAVVRTRMSSTAVTVRVAVMARAELPLRIEK
jgi:hypothetical protein